MEPAAHAEAQPRSTRRALRWAGPVAYAVALTAYSVEWGIPVARNRVLLWILLGLLAFSLTDVRRWVRGVALEWAPFVLILVVYDRLRGVADELLPIHTFPQIRADELLFGGTVPTVWLQERLWHGAAQIRWYDYAVWGVYVTHFFGTLLVAGALWFFAVHRFRRYVAMVSVLAATGFATYVLYPAVPPWMASEQGHLGASARIVAPIWQEIPFSPVQPLFEKGKQFANNVAAVPSLHAAYAFLITLALWGAVRWWWRIPLAVYPVAMGFALVYTAEHYVVDILLGWVYALVAFYAVTAAANRLAAGRAAAPVRA